jgi:hypothetical protein
LAEGREVVLKELVCFNGPANDPIAIAADE